MVIFIAEKILSRVVLVQFDWSRSTRLTTLSTLSTRIPTRMSTRDVCLPTRSTHLSIRSTHLTTRNICLSASSTRSLLMSVLIFVNRELKIVLN